jgi:hypothetical protein
MVSAGTDDHFGMNESLPDSVFTDFNKDLSEMDQGSVYQSLNQPIASEYPDEDESQQ